MKTKLLIIIALLSAFYSLAQTDGWFLYTKPNTISAIVPDDTNANILHLATDIGYIQYNTNTSLVTDFLNLTSQNPAIGHVNGLDVNPTNINIALALDDGIAIYDGTSVTIYNYNNSNLTVGSIGGSEFAKLKVRYGRQGELYIFKPDVTGYQIFTAGVFSAEVVTTFRPQDIVENQAGNKVYFAGWNDGLWELDTASKSKEASGAFVNYISSNSDLIYNSLHALHVDSSDLLYIGGFQGLNTMTSAGDWNTYQQLVPPGNVWFYPAYGISLNESNGDLLIQTSTPNSSNFGLTILELGSNTWTNFADDNTNCLNANNFRASAIGGDDNIYSSKSYTDNGSLFKFNHNTNTCSEPDINYLNCPTVANSNLLGDFTVRRKASGNLDIGFTRGENLHILEINPDTFNGTFGAPTTITPSAGKSAYSVLSDNDYFIVETNTGWVFVDGNNATTEFTHSLPGYLAIVTKKAAAFDSDNGIVNLVHKGFDASWNYRVYKTQCNTATGSCSEPEEIFNDNRDMSKNAFFNCSKNGDEISCFGLITPLIQNKKFHQNGPNQNLQRESWFQTTNSPPSVIIDEQVPIGSVFDPIILLSSDGQLVPGLRSNQLNLTIRAVHPKNGITWNDYPFSNEWKAASSFNSNGPANPGTIAQFGNAQQQIQLFQLNLTKGNEQPSLDLLPIPGGDLQSLHDIFQEINVGNATLIQNGPPGGNRIQKSQNQNEASMIMLTNYGMLIKTGIDILGLALSTEDVSINDNNLLLYPNPANNMVSFSNKTIQNIEVFDINGRQVLKQHGNSFSVKTLAQGIYIVKATNTDNVLVTKKLIVD